VAQTSGQGDSAGPSDGIERALAAAMGPADDTSPDHSLERTLAATIGNLPRVELHETEADGAGDSADVHVAGEGAGRLQLRREIARGGMGVVLKGHDVRLGRDLAVKVLLEKHRDNPELVRRFIEEAQIAGQLQHPGVVPVYDMGALPDRRPFFTMKLVKGRTLAAVLADRSSPVSELPRLLDIFERVCETIGYAHSHGVIHRDLKPFNVMVGAFGEVQVMDWGLAKVLPRGGATAPAPTARVEELADTIITVPGEKPDSDDFGSGSVLGTPAYMAPEQARGELETVDERSDVFALGSILCEILTGKPAFVGQSSAQIHRRAARGEMSDALARLAASGADAALVDLARDCLGPEAKDRPRDAGVVAERVNAYLAGVQEKLRSVERERAVAEARAVEEAKRRHVQVALAASIFGLIALGVGFAAWHLEARQRQETQVALLISEVKLMLSQARGHADEPARWVAATEAARRVEVALGEENPPSEFGVLRRSARDGLAAAEAHRRLLDRLVDIRTARADDPHSDVTDASYADAFRTAGIDADRLEPKELGELITRRPPAVARALVSALDDWVVVRRRLHPKEEKTWARLIAAARVADPDTDRDSLRAALLVNDKVERLERLKPLAERADLAAWAPAGIVLLAAALADAGDRNAAIDLLRRASGPHPADVWIHYDLGQLLSGGTPTRSEEAIRALAMARVLRPETGHDLAHSLHARGQVDEAEAVFRDLVRRRPDNARHLTCFARLLKDHGHKAESAAILDRAIAAAQAWVQARPDEPNSHNILGLALLTSGRPDEAIDAFRAELKVHPTHTAAWTSLVEILEKEGRGDEAVAVLRDRLAQDSEDIAARRALGIALNRQGKADEAIAALCEVVKKSPDDSLAHDTLATLFRARGRIADLIPVYREAIKPGDKSMMLHYRFAHTLRESGRLDEAIAEFERAIELGPDNPDAINGKGYTEEVKGLWVDSAASRRRAVALAPERGDLRRQFGEALYNLGDLDGAIGELREGLRLRPEEIPGRVTLAAALRHKGRRAEAIDALRAGLKVSSKPFGGYEQLGQALDNLGELDDALRAYRRAAELAAPGSPAAQAAAANAASVDREIALAPKLAEILKSADLPKDVEEARLLAHLCRGRELYATACRYWAITLQPGDRGGTISGGDEAARDAIAAAAGLGRDDPPPDETARAALRARARAWLEADYDARESSLPKIPQTDRHSFWWTLQQWQVDPSFASVRKADALARLPEAERADWRTFWAKVAQLIRSAQRQEDAGNTGQ
jgi:serine/threonine-protein kinase